MTSFEHQLLALHHEDIASHHDTNPNIEIPLPISLSFLDSIGSLDRLISNPLVRGYSNLSVQSDEGAHFIPYGRGHAEIASQLQQDIHYDTSIEPSTPDIPQNVESKVIQHETATVSTVFEATDTDGGSPLSISSGFGIFSEPQPTDYDNKSIPNAIATQTNQAKTPEIERTKQKLSLLLKEWKLARYSDVLINEMGYDDIEDWKDITEQELRDEMKFKKGHASRFIRKIKEHFDSKDVSENECIDID
eukprot:114180_1